MDKGLGILENLLRLTSQRHKVLSSNVANADTPGYRAKDLEFKAIAEEELGMRTTDRSHIPVSGAGGNEGLVSVESGQSWGDGNNVELDVEMAKLTENALTHQAGL